jgi:hypothetical protein
VATTATVISGLAMTGGAIVTKSAGVRIDAPSVMTWTNAGAKTAAPGAVTPSGGWTSSSGAWMTSAAA